MRYVLATILVCALGAPAASAMPVGASIGLSKDDTVIQITKRDKAAPKAATKAKSKKSDNGIHPLVGSGEY